MAYGGLPEIKLRTTLQGKGYDTFQAFKIKIISNAFQIYQGTESCKTELLSITIPSMFLLL